jgi:hypothetical protein
MGSERKGIEEPYSGGRDQISYGLALGKEHVFAVDFSSDVKS